MNSPSWNFDATSRISNNKLLQKIKQLSPDRAGQLFIPVEPLHFWHQHTEKARSSFQQRLKLYKHVIGVYHFSEILQYNAGQSPFGTTRQFNLKQIEGPLTRYSLFIRDESFCHDLNPGTMQKIISALQ